VHKSSIWYIHISGLNRGTHLQFGKEHTAALRKQVQGDHFDSYLWNLKQGLGRQIYTKNVSIIKAILSRDFEMANLIDKADLHYIFKGYCQNNAEGPKLQYRPWYLCQTV